MLARRFESPSMPFEGVLGDVYAPDRQRLDPFNGLLLLGTLDALFDTGLITFSDSGQLVRSVRVADAECDDLGLRPGMRLCKIDPKHTAYLQWHRKQVFVNK